MYAIFLSVQNLQSYKLIAIVRLFDCKTFVMHNVMSRKDVLYQGFTKTTQTLEQLFFFHPETNSLDLSSINQMTEKIERRINSLLFLRVAVFMQLRNYCEIGKQKHLSRGFGNGIPKSFIKLLND